MCTIVVLLKVEKLIVVKKDWVLNPILHSNTKVFFSPNKNDKPNFAMKSTYFFDERRTAVYHGYVLKEFGRLLILNISFILVIIKLCVSKY